MDLVARVNTQAESVRVMRLLATIIVAPLYALGYVVGLLFSGVRYLGAAVAAGFVDAGAAVERRQGGD